MDRDPTGSAVCTYSAMIAISTSRLRRARACSLMMRGPSLQHLHEERVGQEEPLLGEARADAVLDEEAAPAPRGEERGQTPRLEADSLVEPGAGNAVDEAQAQDETLGDSLPGREHLWRRDRRAAPPADR